MNGRVRPLPAVLAFMREPAAERHLAEELRGLVTVCICSDETALLAQITHRSPRALVIHVDDRSAELLIYTARAARHTHPFLPIVVYYDGGAKGVAALPDILRLTPTFLFHCDTDRLRDRMRDVLEPIERQCARVDVMRILEPLLETGQARAFAEYCVAHVFEKVKVATVAMEIGLHRRAISRALRTGPNARALICWCRLLMAASLIDRAAGSIEDIALDLNFGSSSALRMMLRRHAHLGTRQLRDGKALAAVAEALATTLRRSSRWRETA